MAEIGKPTHSEPRYAPDPPGKERPAAPSSPTAETPAPARTPETLPA